MFTRFQIRCLKLILCLLLLTLFLLWFFRWRYVDDDGEPLGTVYIGETRKRLDYMLDDYVKEKEENYFTERNIDAPIIVWWTPFTYETGAYTKCGTQPQCFTSNIRKYRDNKDFAAFLFYGTSLGLYDLPLPRREHEQWGLLHEESPKNNFIFSFEYIMKMFNHTATFKRQSDLPVTTQWLTSIDDLLDHTYLVDVKEKTELQKTENLAPIIYVQTGCNTPSDRDIYIQELMKYIPIDSYGKCLHNKDLPEHLQSPMNAMEHDDMLKLVGKYKFALAFENAICTDYITEKLWRPLRAGTVPIFYGSDKIEDFLPDNHSIISILDYATPQELATFLHELNNNDTLYDYYRYFKLNRIISNDTLLVKTMSERTWGIHNDRVRGNFISKFECLVCDRLHEMRKDPTLKYQAKLDHYGCPPPKTFDSNGQLLDRSGNWYRSYEFAKCQVEVFQELMDQHNYTFTESDILQAASKRFSPSFRKHEFLR